MLEFLSESKLDKLNELTLKHVEDYETLRELLNDEKEFFTQYLIQSKKEFDGKHPHKNED